MRHESMTVADIMSTALITLHPGDSVGNADMEMKFAAIRHIPIVDDRNRLVGMVSNRDILRALGKQDGNGVIMRDIMARDLQVVSEDAPAHEAAALILEHRVGAIPVLGEEQQLVGVVTETDFVRIAHQALGGEDEYE